METKKQEAIRKAWGDKYNERVDRFGWCDFNKNYSYNDDLFDTRHYLDCISIRPKSLAGLEANNGWIAIESEEDLPKKLGKYKVVLKDRVPFTWIFETFCDIESSGELWMSRYSHYKKVEEELPPIY